MGFDKVKMRQIRGLLVFATALILLIIYSGTVWGGIQLFMGIITPFLVGGAIAFALEIVKYLFDEETAKELKESIVDKF